MVSSSYRRPHPVAFGALVVGIAAIPGLLLSIFLTIVKFRSSFRCDFAFLSACSTSCSDVLTSPLSTLLGAPISIYSTAYFLVLLGFSLAVLAQPTSFLPIARPILLVFAATGLLAIALLAGYATFVVGGLCLYCLAIYGLTIVAALGVSLLHTDGYRSSLRAWADGRLLTSGAPVIAVLGFLAASSVQLAGYRTMAASLTFGERCLVTGRLPETPLLTPTKNPRVQVALFVDLACPKCREDYATWRAYASARPEVQLAVYHYARGGDCIPAQSTKLNANAENNDSCLAARATLCAEKLLPGAGLAMLEPLFERQDSPSPYFSPPVVAEIARGAGIDDIPVDMADPKTGEHPFFKCLDAPETLDPILEHASFAIARNVVETPASYLLFFDDEGAPIPTMIQILGAKHYQDLDQTISEARQRVLADETSSEASS